ncbi:MAG TPA: hypothetical protein VJZ27_18865, partial [Aggregatilineales bacterium]|nr:hypothetical protein [Aggregatilineales bacterium]
MLVRTFRLTDKISNAMLRLAIYAVRLLLLRILGLRLAIETMIATFVGVGAALFGGIYHVVSRRGTQAANVAAARQQRLRQAMVQRAEQRALTEIDGRVIEDPMIARNRSLSAITVILMIALISFLIWTPGSDNDGIGQPSAGGII